jgi:hypothetical protein
VYEKNPEDLPAIRYLAATGRDLLPVVVEKFLKIGRYQGFFRKNSVCIARVRTASWAGRRIFTPAGTREFRVS